MSPEIASNDPVFVCARCAGSLRRTDGGLVCRDCGAEAPVVEGVVAFAETDGFYDAYADEHAQFHPNPGGKKEVALRHLPFWSWREWRFLRANVPPDGVVLELGCGRGRQLFSERPGTTIGIESSGAAARDCARVYDAVALARLPRIPLPDASVDVVTSAHVIGHLAAEDKDELLAEMRRVLRPGGRTVHIIETDSAHPAVIAAKDRPDAYRERFVEQHGHIGLEHAGTVEDRFRRAGFRVTHTELVEAIVPSAQNTRTFFDHPDFRDLPHLRWSRRFERVTARGGAPNLAYEVSMGMFHRTVEQWMGRPERAQFVHLVARRDP